MVESVTVLSVTVLSVRPSDVSDTSLFWKWHLSFIYIRVAIHYTEVQSCILHCHYITCNCEIAESIPYVHMNKIFTFHCTNKEYNRSPTEEDTVAGVININTFQKISSCVFISTLRLCLQKLSTILARLEARRTSFILGLVKAKEK